MRQILRSTDNAPGTDGRTPHAPGARAPRRTPHRRRALALALTALALAPLVGCAPDVVAAATTADPSAPPVPPALQAFYHQQPAWHDCGKLQCATLTVPMDYGQPDNGKTFELPVIKAAATDPAGRIGSLVINAGGPGASGVSALAADGGLESFGAKAKARFDIVGFDPRGVAGSKPAVDCTESDDAPDDKPSTLYPRTDAERRAELAKADRTLAACQAHSGDILPHVGTLDAARDMDVLRAALGDDKLTYLGWSYGTYLGTIYAEQFPRRVRAMVLDAAIDPALDWTQRVLAAGKAFRASVDDYAEHCTEFVQGACPAGTPDGIRRVINDLYAKTADRPLPVKGSADRLDLATLNSALTASMYSPEGQWQDLSEGLAAAQRGDGTKLAAIASKSADLNGTSAVLRSPNASPKPTATNGTAGAGSAPRDNSGDILTAVNCLDEPHPKDPQAYWDVLDRAHQESDVYGTSGVLAELGCRNWPAGPLKPHRVSADGLAPVLVVGTTGDPATPYQDARSLAAQLPGGMLLTHKGLGHGAYGRSNSCVTDAVDGYLTELKPVPPGSTC